MNVLSRGEMRFDGLSASLMLYFMCIYIYTCTIRLYQYYIKCTGLNGYFCWRTKKAKIHTRVPVYSTFNREIGQTERDKIETLIEPSIIIFLCKGTREREK